MTKEAIRSLRPTLAWAAFGLLLVVSGAAYLFADLSKQVRELERLVSFLSRVTGTTDAIFPAAEEIGGQKLNWIAVWSMLVGSALTLSNIVLAWRQDSRQSAEHRLKLRQLETELQRVQVSAAGSTAEAGRTRSA